jgi:Flp pilus assembly protein TadG
MNRHSLPASLRRKRQSGTAILIFTLLAFTVVVPMAGLAIDGGIMYMLQAKLSQACDAAALAGGRSLNNGDDAAAQTASAEATMTQFFYANFPSGTWNTQPPQLNLNVGTSGLHVRTTTIDATVVAPLYFLSVAGFKTATVSAHGQASRKDVNMMLVLSRSISMADQNVCGQMIAQARAFASQFTNGRDVLGLVTYTGGSNVDYLPIANFKTTTPSLDYTLSQIVCAGNTGTAQALWQGYQQLVSLNQQGALNLIVLFTVGQPNGLTFDAGGSLSSSLPIKTQADTRYGTGFSPYPDGGTLYSMPASSCSVSVSQPATMAQWGGDVDPGETVGMMIPSSGAISNTQEPAITGVSNCYFSSNLPDMRRDIAYIPSQDHWGNSTSGYLANETIPKGPYAGKVRLDTPTSIATASTNAADNAATRIRNNTSITPTIIALGMGGVSSTPIDQVFLERISNDPRSPIYSTTQQTGQFIYASDISQLGIAFNSVASFILRLSQ